MISMAVFNLVRLSCPKQVPDCQAQPDVDFRRVFLKKIMRATPPIVTEGTTDPALWDYRGSGEPRWVGRHRRRFFPYFSPLLSGDPDRWVGERGQR